MALCVAAVRSCGSDIAAQQSDAQRMSPSQDTPMIAGSCARIELTDGWYGIDAIVDPHLSHLVRTGRLRVGMKLRIVGAAVSAPVLVL